MARIFQRRDEGRQCDVTRCRLNNRAMKRDEDDGAQRRARSDVLDRLLARLLVEAGADGAAAYDALAVLLVREVAREVVRVRRGDHWVCAIQSAAVPGERRSEERTAARVREDDLVEHGGEERCGNVGERGDGGVRTAARGHAPDGHCHETRADVTRGVSRDYEEGRRKHRARESGWRAANVPPTGE